MNAQLPACMLYDNHGREINYLRLAVTDRCNLRCLYCMPAEGISYLPQQALLTDAEMERLVRLLANLGINKIRITGGEPFVRKDLIGFLKRLRSVSGIRELHITTNGVLTASHIEALQALGITSVNLSLDTLDRQRFRQITRRDALPQVMQCFHKLLQYHIPVKINTVVMAGKNTEDIIPMTALTRAYPVSVRFIEEMPFNGSGSRQPAPMWTHRQILETLRQHFPAIQSIENPPHATASHYHIPGHLGTVGIIAAFSRTFCGTCNRIRLTAQGTLKTCLYGKGVLDVRHLMRSGATDAAIQEAFLQAFSQRHKDGFAAEQSQEGAYAVYKSMASIGG